MFDTLINLLAHYGDNSKGIVWAHNTHVGSASSTSMATYGDINIGQLAQEQIPNSALIGFLGYQGTVVAGRRWGAPPKIMKVPKAISSSWEAYFKNNIKDDSIVIFGKDSNVYKEVKGQRAIGVVYNPENDYRQYVPTILSGRYDAVIYIEKTTALEQLTN